MSKFSAKEACQLILDTKIKHIMNNIKSHAEFGNKYIEISDTWDYKIFCILQEKEVVKELEEFGYKIDLYERSYTEQIMKKKEIVVKKWFFFKRIIFDEYLENKQVKYKVFKISWCCDENNN